MKNKLLAITLTHGRPEAFARLCRYVEKQTFEDFDWLVISDDCEDYKFPKRAKVVRRDPSKDVLPSICANLLEALKHCDGYEKFVFLEDDDWYHENYVYELNKHLDKADLVGFNEDAYYYVLSRRARRWHNQEHASLAATGFRRVVLQSLEGICHMRNIFIDLQLWNMALGSKMLVDNFTGIVYGSGTEYKLNKEGNVLGEYPRHVGVKENWHKGAVGLSKVGHTPSGAIDSDGEIAQKWFGEEEAQFFLQFSKRPKLGTPFIMTRMPVEQY